MSEFHHVSVLLQECLDGLNIRPDGIYVDAPLAEPDIPFRLLPV